MLFRDVLPVVPDANIVAVASRHVPFHSLQLLWWISQVCIVDRRSRAFLFVQCDVDPENRLVPNGIHSPDRVVLLQYLLGVWYQSGKMHSPGPRVCLTARRW
jgi:hypothetical protein